MVDNHITIGSLFSGIGGLELGLERALTNGGFVPRIAWQCEIEPYARRVLAKHWPNTKRYEDVRTIGRDETIEHADIICGGFPCQDLSYAGKRAGLGGERSGLFWELMRIVRLVRPRYVILENVPGLLTADNGEAMGSVLGALAEAGCDAQWDCFRASESVGSPHHRERWFCIAYPMQARTQRLEQAAGPCKVQPWGWRGKKDLREIYERPYRANGARWSQPLICRMDDGVSKRVDRIAALGNAVVPQVAEVVGNRLVEIIKAQSAVD